MTRVHIFCEGQTEDVFIREVLTPHFEPINIWLNPIILRTGQESKGGVCSYGKIKWQIENKCKEDQTAWITTMLDFYGLPSDFPKIKQKSDSMTKVKAIEEAFKEDINHPNFIPNIVMHEFEGLLFSETTAFSKWFDDIEVINRLTIIKNEFPTPEHINDSRETSPSKRILKICNTYDKVLHGSLISLDIGLETIRQKCPLFNAWIQKLEKLKK